MSRVMSFLTIKKNNPSRRRGYKCFSTETLQYSIRMEIHGEKKCVSNERNETRIKGEGRKRKN
jgi:hypothetical protein